jgi:carbon monoxide dehydrogenase subunit G
MKFAGELSVEAPREEVFDRLKDAHFFACCVKGVRDLKELGPTTYSAQFETRIAYIKFNFDVTVEMTEAHRPVRIAARIEGKPHGIVGRLSATSAADFHENAGVTTIRYQVEATLTGRLGSIGQPVLKAKAKEMEREFVANLRSGFLGGVEAVAP